MPTNQGKILVVDDHSDNREAVRHLLEEQGHEVLEASNGQEALDLLVQNQEQQIRLIILDLQMPIMNGWEFMDMLRIYHRLSTLPVLIVSAHAPLPLESKHNAIVGCLQAPYEIEQFRAMVNACLSAPP